MKIELFRRGKGWLPASEPAQRVLGRMTEGEIGWFKTLRVRSLVDHRRYWGLMRLCAHHCERIELPYGGAMEIHNEDDVHTAIKICVGHVTWVLDAFGKPTFAIPKSTDYESMDADDWAEYWPGVVQTIMERVMPGVSMPEVELELLKCMRLAA